MDKEVLCSLVVEGKVVIPCNKVYTSISPDGLGKRLRTKVNVNLGTSKDVTDYDSGILITRSRWCRLYYDGNQYCSWL